MRRYLAQICQYMQEFITTKVCNSHMGFYYFRLGRQSVVNMFNNHLNEAQLFVTHTVSAKHIHLLLTYFDIIDCLYCLGETCRTIWGCPLANMGCH